MKESRKKSTHQSRQRHGSTSDQDKHSKHKRDRQSSSSPTPSSQPRLKRRRLKRKMVDVNDVKHVTSTGSILTLQSAGHVLSRYINSYGNNPTDFHQETTFTVVPQLDVPIRKKPPKPQPASQTHQPPPDSLFVCTLSLPPGCPVGPMTSPGYGFQSKDAAKKRVTFEMVKVLIRMGEIDENLIPRPRSVEQPKESRKELRYEKIARKIEARIQSPLSPLGVPPPEDQRTSLERIKGFREAVTARLPPKTTPVGMPMPGVGDYGQMSDANFWTTCASLSLDNLYVALFTVVLDKAWSHINEECRTMCFITSKPLPFFRRHHFRDIDIGMPKVGSEEICIDARIRLAHAGRLMVDSTAMLDNMVAYTQRLVRSHVHKDVTHDLASAKWLMVPLRYSVSVSMVQADQLANFVDWDEVVRGAGDFFIPFTAFDLAGLEAETFDALTTTHMEFTKRSAVKAIRTDLKPDSALPGENGTTALDAQIVEPTINHPNQPLLEVEALYPSKMGGLVASVAFPPQRKFLIPELAAKHCISASVSRATSNLPSFFAALDSVIIAQELSQDVFDGIIEVDLALMAISAPMAHGLAPKKSYQRLEFLGDTILKLVIVVYLLQRTPETGADWERLHTDRQVMASNRTLNMKAQQTGLPPYIRTGRTRPKDWLPSGWRVVRNPLQKVSEDHRLLGDKTLADVVEALIGAAHESAPLGERLDRAIKAMHRMHIETPGFACWDDLKTRHPLVVLPTRPISIPVMVFGYSFRDPRRGRDALSMSPDRSRRSSFQRYKSIGDAVLDYLVVDGLYRDHPEAAVGALSNMRHSRRGDSCLAAFCAVSGLLDLLSDVPMDVISQMNEYKRNVYRGQRSVEHKTAPKDKWEFWKEIPGHHYLGDVVNATIGAILIDMSWDLLALKKLYEAHLLPFLDKYCIGPNDHHWHPRGILLEYFAARGCRQWDMKDVARRSPIDPYETIVTMHGRRIGQGLGETQHIALRKGCDEAVKRIRTERLLESLCDCPKRKKATNNLP